MHKLFSILTIVKIIIYQVHSEDIKCIAYIDREIMTYSNFENYLDHNCARCYSYLIYYPNYWKNDSLVNNETAYINYQGVVYMAFKNLTNHKIGPPIHFKYSEMKRENKENNLFLSQFSGDHYMDIFLNCCSYAKYCCESVQTSQNVADSPNCPAEWDGFQCWPSTEPGQTQYNICPDMFYIQSGEIPDQSERDYASKECMPNGTWFLHPVIDAEGVTSQLQYVNYDKCEDILVKQDKRIEMILYLTGYSISLLSTIIGLIIFLVYKQYKSLRVKIHLNFFMALMLTSLFSIVYFSQLDKFDENKVSCKVITVLNKITNLTNYCWMLVEGIYLHQMLATMGAIREKRNALYYYLFGWGTSPLVMIVYISVHSMKKYDEYCWTHWSIPEVIWDIIPLACIAVNILLLLNVIRVLFTKLRSTPDHLLSSFKASLALMPVYGIQFLFLVVPFDPYETQNGGLFFLRYFETMVASLQGLMVTSVFCFFNREVHINIMRTFRRRFPKKNSTEMVTEEETVN